MQYETVDKVFENKTIWLLNNFPHPLAIVDDENLLYRYNDQFADVVFDDLPVLPTVIRNRYCGLAAENEASDECLLVRTFAAVKENDIRELQISCEDCPHFQIRNRIGFKFNVSLLSAILLDEAKNDYYMVCLI